MLRSRTNAAAVSTAAAGASLPSVASYFVKGSAHSSTHNILQRSLLVSALVLFLPSERSSSGCFTAGKCTTGSNSSSFCIREQSSSLQLLSHQLSADALMLDRNDKTSSSLVSVHSPAAAIAFVYPSSLKSPFAATATNPTKYFSRLARSNNSSTSSSTCNNSSNTRSSVGQSSTSAASCLTYGTGSGDKRIALVTGASRGIGKVIAQTLAQGGVGHVLCVARSQRACDEAAAEVACEGCTASGHAVDVGDQTAVSRLCDELLQQYPHIDILVNNAGITKDNLFLRMRPEDWIDVINTNLNSAFYFTSPLIKRMVRNNFGRIINMASVVGVGGNPGQANYAASKAGLIGFTRTLGKEYASRHITVNAIAPGFIRSAMTDAMSDAAKAATLASIPAGRMGDPQDVANAVAFLASDQAAYITAQVLPVDGGMLFGAS